MNNITLIITILISSFISSLKISSNFFNSYEEISLSLIDKTAKGYVYHDRNENLRMDEGEQGIEGV